MELYAWTQNPVPHFGNKLEYKSERDKDREYYEEKLKELEDD